MRIRFVGIALLIAAISFAEETPIPSEALTFDQALVQILDRNPNVGIQKANLDSARAKNASQHLALLPNLSLQASQSTLGPGTNFLGSVDLNVFRFGSDIAGMRAANAEEENLEFVVKDTVLKTETDGIKAMVAFVQQQQESQILKQVVQMRTESAQIAKERYQRGLLPAQEAEKVLVDLDNDQARVRDSEVTLARAAADLKALLGHTSVKGDWPWKEKLVDPKTNILLQSTLKSLSSRPDWQAAEKRLEGASYRTKQNWGKIFPSLDANVSYYAATQVPTLSQAPGWVGTLTLTIPIFDRLANIGNYKSQVYAQASADLDLEKTRRQARSDWESAKSAFEISVETAKARNRTLTLSRKLYHDNLLRFKKGLASANDLVVDLNRMYESELFAIRGWAVAHQSFSDLCHALGMKTTECPSKISLQR